MPLDPLPPATMSPATSPRPACPPPCAAPAPNRHVPLVAHSPSEAGAATDPDYEALPETAGPVAHMVAGALAGITEHTVMYPVDAIKTRLQMLAPQRAVAAAVASGNGAAILAAGPPQYAGTAEAFARIASTEGLRSLWRGVSSVVVGAGPAHALYFATYEYFKGLALTMQAAGSGSASSDVIDPMWAAGAGATATVLQDALMNPFDVCKQRMQAFSGAQYRSLLHCATTLVRNEGFFRAFYTSYPTTLSMSIPYQSLHFATYEAVSEAINPDHVYDPRAHMAAGATAGALAAAVTTPLDVAKTLLQTQGESPDPAIRAARGMRDAVRLVFQREGYRGFAKGWAPRVLSHMPATAICWTTYEYFKYFVSYSSAANDEMPARSTL
ncbi:Fe(2+) transporter [Allomyces javanicus]|nr:Fe(2+) transporter [Allomyces javanicus]